MLSMSTPLICCGNSAEDPELRCLFYRNQTKKTTTIEMNFTGEHCRRTTRAEEAARREREFQERLSELQARHRAATTAEEATRIQQDVNRLMENRQRELTRRTDE